MHLTRKTIIQMAILTLVTLVAGAVMVFNFIGLPAMLFGTRHLARNRGGAGCACPAHR